MAKKKKTQFKLTTADGLIYDAINKFRTEYQYVGNLIVSLPTQYEPNITDYQKMYPKVEFQLTLEQQLTIESND